MKRTIILFNFLIAACISNAQIFYYDIVPDTTMTGWNAYQLQIDSPMTADLAHAHATIIIWDEFGSDINVQAFANCEVLSSGGFPLALNSGDVIDSTGTWIIPNYATLYDGANGNWQNKTDNYLAVRIQEGSKTYYFTTYSLSIAAFRRFYKK